MLVSFKWMKFCRKNQGVWHLAALGCNPSGGTNNPTKQSLIRSFWTAGLSMKMMEDRFPTSPPAQRGSSLEPEPPWFPHQSTRSSRLSFISAAASWAAFIVHPSAAAFSIIDFEHQGDIGPVSCLEYWGSSGFPYYFSIWTLASPARLPHVGRHDDDDLSGVIPPQGAPSPHHPISPWYFLGRKN